MSRWTRSSSFLLCAVLLAFSTPACIGGSDTKADDSLQIEYVANEGFLISGCGQKVLIDALFDEGVRGYARPDKETISRLERASPPFDDVDLVLATHHHADHFDAGIVARHMQANANKRALFVSTLQAVDKLGEKPAFAARAVLPAEGTVLTIEESPVPLRVINLHHGRNRPIENLGFLFRVCDRLFLHIGDTEATVADLEQYDLKSMEIDIAFIPYWVLDYESLHARVPAIGARTIVSMHMPPADLVRHHRDMVERGGREGSLERIRAAFQNVVILDEHQRHFTTDP